jgi:hypothetical protein
MHGNKTRVRAAASCQAVPVRRLTLLPITDEDAMSGRANFKERLERQHLE